MKKYKGNPEKERLEITVREKERFYFDNVQFDQPVKITMYGEKSPENWWERLLFVFNPYHMQGTITISRSTFLGGTGIKANYIKKPPKEEK